MNINTSILNNPNLVVDVMLWGELVGKLAIDNSGYASFKYAETFISSKLDVAPIRMPLNRVTYHFPQLDKLSFHGLPGMIADSLPDSFGNELIEIFFRENALTRTNALHKLCYVASRGMGALEFFPSLNEGKLVPQDIELEHMYNYVEQILNREEATGDLDSITDILSIGSSVGGARPKVLLALDERTHNIKSGNLPLSDTYDYWILKLDALRLNNGINLSGPQGYSNIEYAYYLMAKDTGITINECRLLEENERSHFMTKRFDRVNGEKIHMQSLAALAHIDFRQRTSYTTYFKLIQRLNLPYAAQEEMYRRMVFNVLTGVTDDHTKNTSFLMNTQGNWTLAPCYDVVCTTDKRHESTLSHRSAVNGKIIDITIKDLLQEAKTVGIKQPKKIINEVISVIQNWEIYATEAGVLEKWMVEIEDLIKGKISG